MQQGGGALRMACAPINGPAPAAAPCGSLAWSAAAKPVQRMLDVADSSSCSKIPMPAAGGAATSSSRSRRKSEHGCRCRSFCADDADHSPAGVTISGPSPREQLHAWLQHMEQDAAWQRLADKCSPRPAHGGAAAEHSDRARKRLLQQADQRATAVPAAEQHAEEQEQEQQQAPLELGHDKTASSGTSSIHRKLSAMLDSDGLPLPAFAILSIGGGNA